MKKIMNRSKKTMLGLLTGLVLLGSIVVFANNDSVFTFGNGKPMVDIVLTGTVERDNQTLALENAATVAPGEVLHWTLVSENKGDAEAKDYKAIGKIPNGTIFVENSAKAQGDATITYSIDAGKTFSKQPMIEEKQADGSVKLVPAPVSMYSHVRFEWKNSLNAKEKLNASYDVRVK